MQRQTAVTGGNAPMDDLTYTYTGATNHLEHVDDGITGTPGLTDLTDQNPGNYTYDATGNLTSDGANGITGITWTPLNKVAQVTKGSGLTLTTITYTYDATGKCILKTVDAPGTENDKSTSYVYDAAGQQLLAVYEKKRAEGSTTNWTNPKLIEAPIYGSSRLGMMLPNEDRGAITGIEDIFTRTLEKKNYELTDHLGNVRSVITDRKLPDGNDKFLPEATTRNYYYPFGMERPLMTASTGTMSYRYGYNGMEKDNAVSPTGVTGANYSTDFREIDTRIGRWWSRDPIVKPCESPYVTFGDNPIAFADPSGLDPVEGGGSGGNSNSSSFVGPPAPRVFSCPEVTITAPKIGNSQNIPEQHAGFNYSEGQQVMWDPTFGSWYHHNGRLYDETAYRSAVSALAESNLKPELGISPTAIGFNGDASVSPSFIDFYTDATRDLFGSNEVAFGMFNPFMNELFLPSNTGMDGQGIADFGGVVTAVRAGAVLTISKVTARLVARKLAKNEVNRLAMSFCFAAGTVVLTSNGSKPIESVTTSDSVWAFDETEKTTTLHPVTALSKREYDGLLIFVVVGADTIKATSEHPFYVDERWVEAQNLKAGDALTLLGGGRKKIAQLWRRDTTLSVYNFTVDKAHTYFVSESGVLVHNNGGICLPADRWIKRDVWNTLSEIEQNKFSTAMQKGLAPTRRDASGIIRLSEEEMNKYPGFTHKIKIDGKTASHKRILGKIETNSNGKDVMIFSKIVND